MGPIDVERIEECRQIVRPEIEVILHERAIRLTVAPLIVANQLELLGKPFPDQAEILPPEERAADQSERLALAHELVIDVDPVGLDLGHDALLRLAARTWRLSTRQGS